MDAQAYYLEQSPITDPGEYGTLYDGLPSDIPGLCQVVQGLIIHYLGGERLFGYAWGLMEQEPNEEELALLDQVAVLTQGGRSNVLRDPADVRRRARAEGAIRCPHVSSSGRPRSGSVEDLVGKELE